MAFEDEEYERKQTWNIHLQKNALIKIPTLT